MTLPTICLRNGSVERIVDTTTYLHERYRMIWLNKEITSDVAAEIISAIMVLDARSSKDIILLVNSSGGSVAAGMTIIDAMNAANSDIKTIAMGTAASMAAIILAAGTPGKRYSMPNSEIMIHQPSLGGVGGSATDVNILTKRLLESKDKLKKMISILTGQSVKIVARHMERDTWFDPMSAKEFGIVDHILDRLPIVLDEEGE